MEPMTEEEDDIPPQEEVAPPRPPRPLSQRPLMLGLIAVGLLVGGWKLSTYRSANGPIADLERMISSEDQREQLEHFRSHSVPPYQLPGRLIFFAGLLLFATAAVKMYRGVSDIPPEPGRRDRTP